MKRISNIAHGWVCAVVGGMSESVGRCKNGMAQRTRMCYTDGRLRSQREC